MLIRICSIVCLGIFLKKIFLDAETNNIQTRNYESSTDFDELLHSKKKKKRNMSGTNMTI